MEKVPINNIVLILRSGGDFHFHDVNLLVGHIHKYWEKENKPNIYCYTDLVKKRTPLMGVTLMPLPVSEWKGWWSKMNLFHPKLMKLRPFLYMDLDTAVLGDISFLFTNTIKNTFITLEDFYRKGGMGSALMNIPHTKSMDDIYKKWKESPDKWGKQYKGDQNFLEKTCPAELYWQSIFRDPIITTFKPNKKWRIELPANSTIVCFHGKPRIGQAATKVEWVDKYMSYAI